MSADDYMFLDVSSAAEAMPCGVSGAVKWKAPAGVKRRGEVESAGWG